MTKEELRKEARFRTKGWKEQENCVQAYIAGAEPREKRIAELEEKISILLSCKNCPDNKGGLICQKEYEDKCLSQKIQYIKELKEENAELKENNKSYEEIIDNSSTALMKEKLKNYKQLSKAKKLIRDLLSCLYSVEYDRVSNLEEAEAFLKEVEK